MSKIQKQNIKLIKVLRQAACGDGDGDVEMTWPIAFISAAGW